MGQTSLTFNTTDRHFYVTTPRVENTQWSIVSKGIYRTRNLKAAATFRPHADETAEKVFKRAFSKMYKDPTLPQLSFLDPHQIEGVRWILTRSRSYLAHAPGAGKTAQAIIASCLSTGPGQTLFIVPPSLTTNWEREIWKFTEPLGIFPTIGIVPYTADQDQMAWRADFIICADSMLTRSWVMHALKNMRIKFLAVDEASRFKEPTSERSKAFYGGQTKRCSYPGLFQKARHTVFLDGSPMPNRPMELWAPTFALDPEAIDCLEYHDFGVRYCGAKIGYQGAWEYKYSSNEAELKLKLQKRFMHVVPEAGLSHPERLRSMLFINYDVRTPELKAWEKSNLKKINLSDISENLGQGAIAHHRQQLGMAKVPWIANYVHERLTIKNESILIFCWHREVAMELYKRLSGASHRYGGLVIGGTKPQDREKIFNDFQSGKIKWIVGNILAMGRGFNLQKANRVVFGEYSWSNESNIQCEKRSSRRGNHNTSIRCEYVVATGSMDEVVLNSIFTKEKRVKDVIG